MKIILVGKNVDVTEALKDSVEKKLSRLDKYFTKEYTANVTLKVQKSSHTIEVTIPMDRIVIRCEETTDDMYTSIDFVVDKLERQIRKQKTKLSRNMYNESLRFAEIKESAITSEPEEDGKIVKTKKFAVKPMSAEEAVLQMELVGHNFFVYMNDKSNEVNVVYKRKDGNYGLIEPEFD
ncbi:ribosome-associated translation inhibitor RaiA [uncultured Clostridium sp.]|uniref:ribosome hibernation-promoting factor, HPF/YfiA family n=1 Tax=uncultured Clostridium sp. TaxID=59620 RepID=UPI0025EC6DEA|nr:ribosome-associated translation inhibitor RaiA [uncultured Clostridium sp.]